jgi:hypothetical protein
MNALANGKTCTVPLGGLLNWMQGLLQSPGRYTAISLRFEGEDGNDDLQLGRNRLNLNIMARLPGISL